MELFLIFLILKQQLTTQIGEEKKKTLKNLKQFTKNIIK